MIFDIDLSIIISSLGLSIIPKSNTDRLSSNSSPPSITLPSTTTPPSYPSTFCVVGSMFEVCSEVYSTCNLNGFVYDDILCASS